MDIPNVRQQRVLSLLIDQGESRGVDLIEGLNRSTAYSALKRMEKNGWVMSRRIVGQDNAKRYKITMIGKQAYARGERFMEGR